MTEAEAMTKWCPFVRITPETGGYHPLTNRVTRTGDGDDNHTVMCLGSACMAWRTTSREDYETKYSQTERPDGEGWEPVTDSPGNCAWRRKLAATKINGFCGLASTP